MSCADHVITWAEAFRDVGIAVAIAFGIWFYYRD